MSRRIFLGELGFGAVACGYVGWVEPRWFDLSFNEIRIPGAKKTRILHISDLHLSDGLPASQVASAIASGLHTKPDLVLFTGDYVTHKHPCEVPVLTRIVRMAADTAPTYGVVGNHDGTDVLRKDRRKVHSGDTVRMRALLEKHGLRMLHNRAVVERGLQLVGVGDIGIRECREEEAFDRTDPQLPTILLCHNPDGKDLLKNYRWDLMLSGHTHGGQVRLGPVPVLWAPVRDKNFIAGLYQWRGRQIYITRGAGSPRHVRFACRPEVSVLDVASA